jgi:hypothetical protein
VSARAGAAALALALALLAAGRTPAESGPRNAPGDPESTSALEFVHQQSRPGDRIDGRVPTLYVNASDSDRVVAIGWKKRPENLHGTAHAIAAYAQDSCLVEWVGTDGAVVKETCMLLPARACSTGHCSGKWSLSGWKSALQLRPMRVSVGNSRGQT